MPGHQDNVALGDGYTYTVITQIATPSYLSIYNKQVATLTVHKFHYVETYFKDVIEVHIILAIYTLSRYKKLKPNKKISFL